MNEDKKIIDSFINIISKQEKIDKEYLLRIYQLNSNKAEKNVKEDYLIFEKKLKYKDIITADIYSEIKNGLTYFIYTGKNKMTKKTYNKIFFGPPGTGKSYKIKKMLIKEDKIFRVTFFEEFSYYDFVGQYKPIVLKDYSSKISTKADQRDSEKEPSPVISYNFIPGIFIKSYVEAYNNPDKNVYLIIEEINRGNCSSIFGDIFQLLDRDQNGSRYPIKTSVEVKSYLKENIKNKEDVFYNDLNIPPNLIIYATMNTSDQSLFPIDSAFKRRWSQEYCSINYHEPNLIYVEIEGTNMKWLDFINDINEKIFLMLKNEDKQIGQWFVDIDNQVSREDFLYKVISYLYYDVFKHYRDIVFKDLSFDKIIIKSNEEIIRMILKNE